EPFSGARLVAVSGTVSAIAFAVACLAVRGVEPAPVARGAAEARKRPVPEVLARVWAEADSRRFTIFIFVAMLAYSAQELILEPFAGL
ncbi:BCD family MFS transporter, partial [Escherichia coli]|nr:BCD family MFS transporter [Escherichia coli]